MECPIYLAYMLMGAVSKDKTHIRFSPSDNENYRIEIMRRNQQRRKNG